MDSQNIEQSQQTIKLFELACDFCGFDESRRGGLSCNVQGRNRFICRACCDDAGATTYDEVYGRPARQRGRPA